jgi:heme O synthase-like polyprenyltransferase
VVCAAAASGNYVWKNPNDIAQLLTCCMIACPATRHTAGVVCGAAASGNYVWNDPKDIAMLLTCCMMSGPFLTGYTQTINDYYDREIDAINEPYRPIPSGGRMIQGLSACACCCTWQHLL